MENNQPAFEQPEISYGTFWQRLLAILIDSVILAPLIVLNHFDKTTWKNPELYILLDLTCLFYKPFCEYKYGATVGKMVLKLKVLNTHFQKADLKEILLRNSIDIIYGLIILITAIIIFDTPEFQHFHLHDFHSFSPAIKIRAITFIVIQPVYLTEIIFLLSDKQKRALHDRIGKTVVIKRVN